MIRKQAGILSPVKNRTVIERTILSLSHDRNVERNNHLGGAVFKIEDALD